MVTDGRELRDKYVTALRDHLVEGGETSLHEAYDLGRRALTSGLGVVNLALLHHESLASILGCLPTAEASVKAARGAAEVQAESLSVFEMALRGYRETNEQLMRLNRELTEQAAALADSNERYRQLTADLEKLAAAERQSRLDLERTHQELKKTQSQLVHSAKLTALGQLVAGVAHEINNPLAFVLNNLAVLERHAHSLPDLIHLYDEAASVAGQLRQDLQQRIVDLADQIDLPYILENFENMLVRSHAGLKRIQRIVQDLRDFARIDQASSPQEIDLNAAIASTLDLIQARARLQHVELEVDLEPLPQVTCSPSKINQVLLNLGVNAIDACSAGGKVTVRTRGVAGGVEIHVIDNGCGIDPAIRDRIFDPFFTTKEPGKGTGLGLSISHALVEEHHGRIEVDSTPGQGAHFIIRLPLKPPTLGTGAA
ncbi:MAG: ATP-binding protein [Isosphaeraceae bacterium]